MGATPKEVGLMAWLLAEDCRAWGPLALLALLCHHCRVEAGKVCAASSCWQKENL